MVGLAVGLAAAFALTRIMSGLLFHVAATDVATFSATPVVIAAIAVFATWVPARRALSVEPMTELRSE
jgi:ABC-type antimicrobial peptide transport system permease subunit